MAQEFYTGTVGAGTVSTIIAPRPWRADAERVLGSGRRPATLFRSWAASSIRDATAITAIRAYSRSAPASHQTIHVYRVELVPIHIGPLVLVDVLQERLDAGAEAAALEPLIREYWNPTGDWHLQEILAQSLTILAEVPATSERDVYLRRWVHYKQDRERAEAL